jgi:tRNA 2-thiouridine synthesizing protein A
MVNSTDFLDARGLKCPLPVLKARKWLKELPSGAILTVLADDPAGIVDFPHFCNEAGHTLLATDPNSDGGEIYKIKKK